MSEAGAAIVVVLGAALIIAGMRGTLLQAAHQLDTAVPNQQLKLPGEAANAAGPIPGAPGSGVTTA
jgi:hypothetical protein